MKDGTSLREWKSISEDNRVKLSIEESLFGLESLSQLTCSCRRISEVEVLCSTSV